MLGPLWSISQTVSSYNQSVLAFAQVPVLKDAFVIECVFTCFVTVYGFLVGWRILNGSTEGKRLALQYLRIRLCGFLIVEALVFSMLNGLSAQAFDQMVVGLYGIVIREVIYFLVWWVYFHKSKRIRNTYREL